MSVKGSGFSTTRFHRRIRSLTVAALVLFVTGAASAQPARPGRGPRTGEAKGLMAKPIMDGDAAVVEDELAQYLQFRGEVGPEGAARLELLIDLRVLARWFLSSGANAQPDGDLQIACYLRAAELRACAATLAEHFKTAPKPTPAQLDAMSKVHALTFALTPLKDVKQADDLCREVGSQLAIAGGPLPADVRQIPLMRPTPRSFGPTTPAPPMTPAAPEVDPASRANLLTVSPSLKKQVLALLAASDAAKREAGTDPKKREESAAVQGVLLQSLTLAEGISRGIGVDANSRPALEQTLADGLALYADPRTRSAGQRRIAALDAYSQTLARIRRMNLKPDLAQKLAPALSWAAARPEEGPKMMAAIEGYIAACNRHDAKLAAPPPNPPLPAREAKLASDALRQCGVDREAFLTDVASLSRVGIATDASAFSSRVAAMNASLEAAQMFERLPKALATVLAYKPKPTGGIERRVAAATVTLAEPRAGAAREEASRTLNDLLKVADLAAEIEGAGAVSPEVIAQYGRGKMPAFDAKRKELVAELANLLASSRELDTGKLQKIEQMGALRTALQEAQAFEAAIKRSDVLSRWVDWPVAPAELGRVFDPHRNAVAAMVEALATDATPPATWSALRARYGPPMRLVARVGSYADVCGGFPAGWPAHAGRLMTPMAGQPFDNERFVAVGLKIWARYEEAGDTAAAQAVSTTVAGHSGR